MASPAFTINGSATTASVSVASGGAVVASIAALDGVESCAWTIVRTDDTGTPGDSGSYGAAALSGPVDNIATWAALTPGTAATIQCTINGGIAESGYQDTALTTTGKFYVPLTGGGEVCVAGEQHDDNLESSSTHGIISPINRVIRAAAGAADWKASVRTVSAAALPAYTRTANVLLADAVGAMAAVGGVALAAGEDFLLKDGAAGADNGIYRLDTPGSAGTEWQATRRYDADETGEIVDGTTVAVAEGTYAGYAFRQTASDVITINTTAQVWTNVGALTLVTATDAGTVSPFTATAGKILSSDGATAGGTWRSVLVLGASPATAGTIRTEAAAGWRALNAAGLANIGIASIDGADSINFGFTDGSATLPATANVNATTSTILRIASTPVLTCAAAIITAAQHIQIADGKYFAMGTTDIATAGTYRDRNGWTHYVRNGAGTQNARVATLSGADVLTMGEAANVASSVLAALNECSMWVGGASIIRAQPALITLAQPVAYGSGTVAAAGDERCDKNHSVMARNAANTADLAAWSFDGSDNLWLGGPYATRPATLQVDPAGSTYFKSNGSDVCNWSGAGSYWYVYHQFADAAYTVWGATNPASAGTNRYRIGATAYGRNNASAADGLIWSWTWSGTKDELTFGDVTNVDNLYLRSLETVMATVGGTDILQLTPTVGAWQVPAVLKAYTVAGLPAAGAGYTGAMAYCTNETGGAVPVFCDGTNWRRVTDRAVAS